MKRATFCCFVLSLMGTSFTKAQSKLSVKWEELTAADFRDAIQQSKGTCLLPFGILEKHGPHLPLGTDLLNVRYASLHAAEKEFAKLRELHQKADDDIASKMSASPPSLPQ